MKPSNVLIDENDQPRVTDFGLAKRLTTGSDLTLTGQILGSVSYMSPEQATGKHGEVGVPSDIYSLGVVLYELLCGRRPYRTTGASSEEAARAVCEQEPPRPSTLTTMSVRPSWRRSIGGFGLGGPA